MGQENNNSQATESTQPEMPTSPTQTRPEPTRLARACRVLSGLAHRRPVRIATQLTAAVIVVALGMVGYRHYQPSLSWNREA